MLWASLVLWRLVLDLVLNTSDSAHLVLLKSNDHFAEWWCWADHMFRFIPFKKVDRSETHRFSPERKTRVIVHFNFPLIVGGPQCDEEASSWKCWSSEVPPIGLAFVSSSMWIPSVPFYGNTTVPSYSQEVGDSGQGGYRVQAEVFYLSNGSAIPGLTNNWSLLEFSRSALLWLPSFLQDHQQCVRLALNIRRGSHQNWAYTPTSGFGPSPVRDVHHEQSATVHV